MSNYPNKYPKQLETLLIYLTLSTKALLQQLEMKE